MQEDDEPSHHLTDKGDPTIGLVVMVEAGPEVQNGYDYRRHADHSLVHCSHEPCGTVGKKERTVSPHYICIKLMCICV